jgi:hypothetical protein
MAAVVEELGKGASLLRVGEGLGGRGGVLWVVEMLGEGSGQPINSRTAQGSATAAAKSAGASGELMEEGRDDQRDRREAEKARERSGGLRRAREGSRRRKRQRRLRAE